MFIQKEVADVYWYMLMLVDQNFVYLAIILWQNVLLACVFLNEILKSKGKREWKYVIHIFPSFLASGLSMNGVWTHFTV